MIDGWQKPWLNTCNTYCRLVKIHVPSRIGVVPPASIANLRNRSREVRPTPRNKATALGFRVQRYINLAIQHSHCHIKTRGLKDIVWCGRCSPRCWNKRGTCFCLGTKHHDCGFVANVGVVTSHDFYNTNIRFKHFSRIRHKDRFVGAVRWILHSAPSGCTSHNVPSRTWIWGALLSISFERSHAVQKTNNDIASKIWAWAVYVLPLVALIKF